MRHYRLSVVEIGDLTFPQLSMLVEETGSGDRVHVATLEEGFEKLAELNSASGQ